MPDRVIQQARSFGLKVIMETHCGLLVCSLALAWNVCCHFNPVELGVVFDIPNFAIEGAIRVHVAVAVLSKYIDHVHIGGAQRSASEANGQGYLEADHQWTALTEGDLHIPTWVAALHNRRQVRALDNRELWSPRTWCGAS